LICAAIVSLLALTLYLRTLAPTVTLVDSGELILAARSLGVAHPPGFPLYVMLAHLATLVPLGNVAVRVNFASAVFAALASGVVTLLVSELVAGTGRRHRLPGLAVAVSAGLLLACSRTLWAYATIAEVYTLNALLILTILFLMLRWRRLVQLTKISRPKARKRTEITPVTEHDRWLYAAAILFGLALGVHHVTVASILPGIAVLVYRTEGARFFIGKRLLFAALFSFAALCLVYSYLPIAAARDPIFNWGNPHSLSGVWRHLSGWQYQAYFSFDSARLAQQLDSCGHLLLREFGPGWLPVTLGVALAGLIFLFRRDRSVFWLLALILLVNAGYNLSYFIEEDRDAYYLPTFIMLITSATVGVYSLGERIAPKFQMAIVSLLGGALPAIALAANWPFNDRSRYFIAADYVANIEQTMAPAGLLLTLDWQVASPMLYTREIAGQRRDLKVIDLNLLRRSWYFDYLKRSYPDLIERSRPEVETFLGELKEWEKDPSAYSENPILEQRISAKFVALCEAFVRHESQVAPVYVRPELLFSPGPETVAFAKWLGSDYAPVPKGLNFELMSDRIFHEPGELELQTRGLADGTLHFEDDDVVRLKVLPAYTTMLINRGRYLAAFNQHARAIEAYQRALELDPQSELARESLRASLSKLPKP
jgi:tetratricopeptide (TPR) repeat protein